MNNDQGLPRVSDRQAYIRMRLQADGGGGTRARLASLRALGYTDEEISDTLHLMQLHLEVIRAHLENPPGHRNWREEAIARLQEKPPVPTLDLPGSERLRENRERGLARPRQVTVGEPLNPGDAVHLTGVFEVDDETAARIHAKDINAYSIDDGKDT